MVEWINGVNTIKYENAGSLYLFKGFMQCLATEEKDIRFIYDDLDFKLIKKNDLTYNTYIDDKFICELIYENDKHTLNAYEPEDFFRWLELVIFQYNTMEG